ncbi:MAG: hypothetical protein ACLVFI_00280 [Christensenellales bacterium]
MRKKMELILVMLTLAGLVMVSKKLEKYVNSDKVEKKRVYCGLRCRSWII